MVRKKGSFALNNEVTPIKQDLSIGFKNQAFQHDGINNTAAVNINASVTINGIGNGKGGSLVKNVNGTITKFFFNITCNKSAICFEYKISQIYTEKEK